MWKKAEKFLSKDEYIAPLIAKYGRCRIKPSRKSKYFEDLVDAIVSQQLSSKAAATIFARVKGALKDQVTEEKLTAIKTDALRKCGLSYAKCSYVKDLAEKAGKGEIDLKKLGGLSDEEVIAELTRIKGIGRWTAEMFLMFSLARADVFPVDDLGIKKGIEKILKKRIKPRNLGRISLRWKPYRTVASWYVWRVLDSK